MFLVHGVLPTTRYAANKRSNGIPKMRVWRKKFGEREFGEK